ncbi:MAG: RNA methyltransferase [Panacagrimonas sp.]
MNQNLHAIDSATDGSPLSGEALLERVRVVLVAPQHPGNIGAAARAMMNMGLSRLTLVRPKRFPSREAFYRASSAKSVVENAQVVERLEDAVADCAWVLGSSARPRHLGDEPLHPEQAASGLLASARTAASVALVFGCERTGLTNAELDQCQARTIIPANPGYPSLNVAAAVQIYCYALRMAAVAPTPVAAKREHPWYAPASAKQLADLHAHLERVLRLTGFLDPENPRLLMRRLKQLVSRANPDLNEVNILRGILTSVERTKIRTKRPKTPSAKTGVPSK